MIASGSFDETIRIWDIELVCHEFYFLSLTLKGKTMNILHAHSDPVTCIDWTYDATKIVSGSYDGLMYE